MNRDYIWVGGGGKYIFVFLIPFCISQISYNELTNFCKQKKKFFCQQFKIVCSTSISVKLSKCKSKSKTNTFSRNNKNCLQTTSPQTYPPKGDPEGCRASWINPSALTPQPSHSLRTPSTALCPLGVLHALPGPVPQCPWQGGAELWRACGKPSQFHSSLSAVRS